MSTSSTQDKGPAPFGRYFKHWRSGVIYDAHEYGHKVWPFGKGGPRKRK